MPALGIGVREQFLQRLQGVVEARQVVLMHAVRHLTSKQVVSGRAARALEGTRDDVLSACDHELLFPGLTLSAFAVASAARHF